MVPGDKQYLLMASPPVLLFTHLFHPVNGFAIKLFLNRDVRHGRGGRGAMPMLFARRKPDHVTRPDFFGRPTLARAKSGWWPGIRYWPKGGVLSHNGRRTLGRPGETETRQHKWTPQGSKQLAGGKRSATTGTNRNKTS